MNDTNEVGTELVATAHGLQATYRMVPPFLVIVSPAGERRIELGSVVRVRLAALGNLTMCELHLRDGATRVIANENPAARDAYARLVTRLHAELAASGAEIKFVRGSWTLVGLLSAVGIATCGVGYAVGAGWLAVSDALRSKALLIELLGLAWVVVGPLLVWRSVPRRYDPRNLPKDLVWQR